ncbi:MAG: DNA polymerase III subunit delta [Chloroflexota bacterium]
MDRRAPRVYLLYGDDDLARSEFIHRLGERLGDAATASLNIQTFNAEGLDLARLEEACASMPFLAPRRLILLHQPSALLRGAERRGERLWALLEALPQTTALLLVETCDLREDSPLRRWAAANPEAAFVRGFFIPHGQEFVRWLRQRCQALGGDIEPAAAARLAELVADDPPLAAHELEKLLDYVNRERPIQADDVEQLTPFKGQSDVFAMVDALGAGNGRLAQAHLHRLLMDESPRYAFAMIIRQFRLLLQAREAMDSGDDPQAVLEVHPFVARKVLGQARRFSLPELERIYHLLLDCDLAMKTSQMDDTVALDTLLASLTPAD